MHLIDTPGFDDSGRSDKETLQELAYWLATAHQRGIRLSGIIYVHRITDIRLQGSAWRGLRALKGICGDQNLRNVVIATTMWDRLAAEHVSTAFARHEQLRKKINGEIGAHGGMIVALKADDNAAIELVEQIVRQNSRTTLAFQTQLVDQDIPLDETDAGRILFGCSGNYYDKYGKAIDKTHGVILGTIQAEQAADFRRRDLAIKRLTGEMIPLDERQKRMELKMSEIRVEWEARLKKDNEALAKASRINRELFDTKMAALKNLHCSEKRDIPLEDIAVTKAALVEDLEELGREKEYIMWKQTRSLDNRRGTSNSTTFGVVGASLAVGQLVATMACIVM